MIMSMATEPGQLRIGEFARRVGVAPELLRAFASEVSRPDSQQIERRRIVAE
jgi:hypothetical protein